MIDKKNVKRRKKKKKEVEDNIRLKEEKEDK
jgi:hypothetical protein